MNLARIKEINISYHIILKAEKNCDIFQGTYRYDGEVFTAQDGCNRCWCNKGEIICPFEDDCQNAVARRRAFE